MKEPSSNHTTSFIGLVLHKAARVVSLPTENTRYMHSDYSKTCCSEVYIENEFYDWFSLSQGKADPLYIS